MGGSPARGKKSRFDVVAVGEINADLILSGDVEPAFGQVEKTIRDADLCIGSSAAIFACGAARLGLKTAIVGKVGRDIFGDFMMDRLLARGIDTSGVVVDREIRTGLTVILSKGRMLGPEDFPDKSPSEGQGTGRGSLEIPEEGLSIRDMEIELVRKTLQKCRGNKSLAAQSLGISRKALYEKMERYGITV